MSFILPHFHVCMCVYACVHMCGCIYAHLCRARGWCQQSSFITLRPYSLSKVSQPNAELAACSGDPTSTLGGWNSRWAYARVLPMVLILGWHMLLPQSHTSPYLFNNKNLHLLHGREEGEGEHVIEARGVFSTTWGVGGVTATPAESFHRPKRRKL